MAQTKSVEAEMLHIQKQLRLAICDHQVLQFKLKNNCENAEVKKELSDLQRYIATLGASQRRLMKIMRMKHSIRNKNEAVPEKKQCLEDKAENSENQSECKNQEMETETAVVPKQDYEEKVVSLEQMKIDYDLDLQNLAHSIDRKFGIPLEIRKLDEKENFLACLELVSLDRAKEIGDVVQKYKADYALKNPLLEIPKADPSQRRRNETYLSCVPKTRKRIIKEREPSSERESKVADDATHEGASSEDLPEGPDQPFNEHQFSQESAASTHESEDCKS
ncbi:uncharacterized protein LOC132203267 [Neocloeon triangulifer]|uniref:uncharacterized protein LOC132203267 n=1 Tax=Neocloeon triangulifer TaxID=2078957 RepID=UPI00286EE313|nr:uncharacterized protein LOC132203267 [Neocloeon triangulifer]